MSRLPRVLFAVVLTAAPSLRAVMVEPDGTAVLENEIVAVALDPRPGPAGGLKAWRFKPTGGEMIDVLYGQTDYVKGHVLGEKWDPVTARPGGSSDMPAPGRLYVPVVAGRAADGSGQALVQVAEGAFRLTRTVVLRRDAAFLEVRYKLENMTGPRASAAMRLHSAMSPGARGPSQRKDDSIFLATEQGVLALDQSLPLDQYKAAYGDDVFFHAGRTNEPPRSWTNPRTVTTPRLTGTWAAWVNREHGDGLALVLDEDAFLGFYNCPGITLEPVARAVELGPGDIWEASLVVASFTGAKGLAPSCGNPLFLEIEVLQEAEGRLTGRLLPFWKGTVRVADKEGRSVFEAPAAPTGTVAIAARVGPGWSLVALDTAGRELGRIGPDGRARLAPVEAPPLPMERPDFTGPVYVPEDKVGAMAAFLADGAFTLYAAAQATESEQDLARSLARDLGVGLAWTQPGGRLLMLGQPGRHPDLRDAGLLKRSVTAEWPGPGRGAILYYDSLEATGQPALLVTGGDAEGVGCAVRVLRNRFLKERRTPAGFDFWAVSPAEKVYPYSRPATVPALPAATLRACRGEYEPAQFVVAAYEDLRGLEVTLAPLVHTVTGKPMTGKYTTPFQQRRGPLWLRWVNYFPIEPDRWQKGWTGYPDPLLDRPEKDLAAGSAQALWLSVIVPRNAASGVYTSAITCRAGDLEKTIPFSVEVRDFELPERGLMGEPFTYLNAFPANLELKDDDIEWWTRNMIEHGMRVLHMPAQILRWHISPGGAYKGMTSDWFTVSEDGVILLDHSTADRVLAVMDKAAAPHEVRVMFYAQHILDTGPRDFQRVAPDRFRDQPARGGSWINNAYSEALFGVFRTYAERRGLLPRLTVKVGDEPPGFDAWWTNQAAAAREAGLPVMTAFNSLHYPDAVKGLGRVRQWMPLYMLYDADFFAQARAAGDLVSWYNCGPPPKITVTAPAAEVRGYLWQAAKADLDIVTWWGIQNWNADRRAVWDDRHSHHDSVVYPEHPAKPPWQKPGVGWVDKAPLDSIRWEMIREGMEDAWYVNLLRQRLAAARAAGRDEAAHRAQAVLDGVWREVFPTLNHYRPSYEAILESRERIAAAILDLGAE
jgi:hypothetical protein